MAEIAISMYGPVVNTAAPMRSRFVWFWKRIHSPYAAFAIIVAGAEAGVVAGLLECVVEVAVHEELDALFQRDFVATDRPIDLRFPRRC